MSQPGVEKESISRRALCCSKVGKGSGARGGPRRWAAAGNGCVPEAHRRFLLSFEAGAPDWPLLDAPNAPRLPAVQWRMANLARLDARRCSDLVAALDAALAGSASGMRATHPRDVQG